jgi:hypothetical protein
MHSLKQTGKADCTKSIESLKLNCSGPINWWMSKKKEFKCKKKPLNPRTSPFTIFRLIKTKLGKMQTNMSC